MNSDVPFPVTPSFWREPRSREVTSSRPLEIDVDRAAKRIGKISRACPLVRRNPARRRRRRRRVPSKVCPFFFPSFFLFPAFSPAHPWKCARKLGRARTGSDFSSGSAGVAPNMARECVGGIPQIGETSKRMYHKNPGTPKSSPAERVRVLTVPPLYLLLSYLSFICFFFSVDPSNFANFLSYVGRTCSGDTFTRRGKHRISEGRSNCDHIQNIWS